MIKVLLVDDEYYIREGLKRTILWEELGLDLVGEAEDGVQAWKLYQLIQPAIILMDINIPKRNGMELAREIRACNEEVQIIFLTGYDDFELMKSAISLQATDYLLKPVLKDELNKALQKAVKHIVKCSREQAYLNRLHQQVITCSKAVQEQGLIDLFYQRRPLQESLELLSISGIDLPMNHNYMVICSELDEYQDLLEHASVRDRQLYQYAFRKLLEEAMETHANYHIGNDSSNRVLLLLSTPKDNYEGLIQVITYLRQVLNAHLKLQISMGFSSCVKGVGEIYRAYDEAIRAVEYKAIIGGGQTIPYDSIQRNNAQDHQLLNKELYLLSEMRAGNVVHVLQTIEAWSKELRVMAWKDARLVASQLVLFVMRLYKEVGLKNIKTKYASPLVDLYNCRTIDTLLQFVMAYFTEVVHILNQTKAAPSYKMIEQAKEWIRNHLSEDLSLNNLAHYLNMSPKYLSMRFKQATGETFGEFSTRVRFDLAKELLMDPSLKVLDTAVKVGFTDTNYFSMAFKKYIGITPTEYRKRFL